MKIKEMSKEELEVLSYADLTELILKDNKKSMNTPSIFKKICELLELTEEDYTNQIGEYYTSLTTDKRFLLLDNAEWDLKDNHKVKIDLDELEELDEAFDEENEELEDEEETVEDESIEITDDEVDLDDDMEDLSIVDDDELEEEEM